MNRTRMHVPVSSRTASTVRRRYAPWLRCLSLLLALCCFWSFAGSGVAMAAAPGNNPHATNSPFHAPRFIAPPSPFETPSDVPRVSAPAVVPVPIPVHAATPLLSVSRPSAPSQTLLDDIGHLQFPVSAAQTSAWKQELKTTCASNHRAAQLHLWMGEFLLAQDQQPRPALWHFREAKALASNADPLHYLAAYDNAVGLFYAGAYQESTDAFSHLLAVRHTAHGFNRQYAALWLRHVSACAGYHTAHSALGIPEPTRLDPLCAAAALAARLKAMGRPWDQKTLLRACRVTGEGSNLQDVLDAGPKLGVSIRAVTADDQGLIALPKPLVAYVEHDHFVALTRADRRGVSYLCSDCGPWPGGRIDLTWKQWHTMDAGLYATVTEPGSAWDKTLAGLKAPGKLSLADPPVQVASARLGGLLPRRVNGLVSAWPLLRGHVVLPATPTVFVTCGRPPLCLNCTPGSNPPEDVPHALAGGGPQGGDPVNLATGQEEYNPEPDLKVYNPVGPLVAWGRMYSTLRGPDGVSQSDDFGVGWSQPYNVGVIVSGATGTVLFANGGKIGFTFSGTPTSGHPLLGNPSRSGVPLLLQWDYDGSAHGHYEIIFKDRTHWITGSSFAPNQTLPLAQITDRNGNSIYFNYPTVSTSLACSGWPLLGSITTGPNGTGTVLLSVQRNTSAGPDGNVDGNITSVTDHPGTPYSRSVCYQAARQTNLNTQGYSPYYVELTHVSQIVPAVTAGTPDRFAYGYKPVWNGENGEQINCLHTITVPSPAGSGTSTAYLWYLTDNTADANGATNPNYRSDAYAPFVSALVDANGNRRLYSATDGSGNATGSTSNYTQVTVQNSTGSSLYSYQVSYDSNLNAISRTDGSGRVLFTNTYADANSPYSPSVVLDGNASRASIVPAAQPGATVTLTKAGGDSPGTKVWDIVGPSGVVIASDDQDNGWSVDFGSYYSSGRDYTLVVQSPSNAPLGKYEIRVDGRHITPSEADYDECAFLVLQASGSAPSFPSFGTTTYTYDPYGNVQTKTSPRQTTTTYTYSYANFVLGELTQVQEGTNLSQPKAPTTYTYYEPGGLVRSVTMPMPGTVNATQTSVTYYTYDTTTRGNRAVPGLGNVITVTTPGNNAASAITTTYNYITDGSYSQPAAIGQPLTVTDNLGKVTHLRYDALGNTVAVKDALGNETDLSYSISNAPLQTVLPATYQTGNSHGGSQTTYLYAEPSALANAQWPAITLQYGAATTVTQYDEGNVGAVRQTVSAYGLEGELLSISGSTEPVSYGYDALYRQTRLTDGGGHTTSYFYNPAGYLQQIVYPGAQVTPPTAPLTVGTTDTVSYPSYDADGNPLSRTDGNNLTTTYTYSDPASRLTDIIYPSGTIGAIHYAYDVYSRRSTMTDGTGGQTYAYDDDNELTSKTVSYTGLPSQTLAYAFYPNGSRHTLTTSQGSFNYSYDGVGRMTSLTNPFSETSAWAYRDNGWLQTQTLGNGATTTYTRNALGEVTRLLNQTAGGATLSDFGGATGMSYDGVRDRLTMPVSMPGASSLSGTTTYTYDYGLTANPAARRGQLTQESSTRNGGYADTYGYDGTASSPGGTTGGPGNPTTFRGGGFGFNADNQNMAYSHDGAGNIGEYNQPYHYDPENRMIECYGNTYTYDGDGRQVLKKGGDGNYIGFVYDGDDAVLVFYTGGGVISTTTWGPNGLLSAHQTYGSSQFYTFDPSGNTCQRLNVDGSANISHLVTAYGAQQVHDGDDDLYTAFGAQWGYRNEGSSLTYLLGHRFYSIYTGQFFTRDPMGYRGGINLYGYTKNNPVTQVDPSGYFCCSGVGWEILGKFNEGAGGAIGVGVGIIIGGPTIVGVPIGVIGGGGAGTAAGYVLTIYEEDVCDYWQDPTKWGGKNGNSGGLGDGAGPSYPSPGPPLPPSGQNGNPGPGDPNGPGRGA